MAQLLAETRKNTAYLRHFVKVVELWESEWKEIIIDPAVKKCLDAAFPRRRHARWTMTSEHILTGVRAGTVFGMIECDVCVPEVLRAHFAEMQPVFKNIRLKCEDLGPFMRRYAEEHHIMTTTRSNLVGSYRGDKILLATPLLRWYLDHGLEVKHMANWSEEIFTMHEVHPSDPPVYRFVDDLDEVLDGTFYEPELQKVSVPADKVCRVESVLQRRKVGWRNSTATPPNSTAGSVPRPSSTIKTSHASVVASLER